MIEGLIRDLIGDNGSEKRKASEKKTREPRKRPEKKKVLTCKYCGLDFEGEKDLESHLETECVGKLVHQRTTVIGKLEKMLENAKASDKEVYDIKEGIKVLQKMERIRKDGKVPVIKLKSVKHAKELKKVIDLRDEIIFVKDGQRDFLNFIIGLKPKLVIGDFTETDRKIFALNKINFASEKEMKVEIKDTCGELEPKSMSSQFTGKEIKEIQKGPELKLVLDLSLVDESGGKKKILQTGKLAVPLIEKKLEEMERSMEKEPPRKTKPKASVEENLEEMEGEMDRKLGAEAEEIVDDPEETGQNNGEKSREIKKEEIVAKELNLTNLKGDYLKIEDKKEEKEKKPGLLSLGKKKVEDKKVKKTLKEAAMENLSKSKEIGDFDKASIIVAHVLKQFIEIKMQCRKELTYMELVEKLKTAHLPLDYLDQIIQFYKDMHIQEYKDEVRVNFQEAYGLAERVINDLA